jgi:hypothetical protein
MAFTTRLRLAIATALGAGTYLAFLYLSYSLFEDGYIPPEWWASHLRSQPLAVATWFSVINGAGAVAAAIPVAIGMVLFSKHQKRSLSLGIGILSALCFMGAGIVSYGFPNYPVAWLIELFQFLFIALSVVLFAVLFTSRALTNGYTATAAIAARLRFSRSRSAAREP